MIHAKYAAYTAKCAVPPAKYAVINKVIPKLSPELSPKRCYAMQNVQLPLQNVQYPMQNTQYNLQNMQYQMQNTQYQTKLSPSYPQSYPQKGVIYLQNMQHHLQNTQHQTKLSPSYPQSYPQWICHRKMDLKNKSKCFILT